MGSGEVPGPLRTSAAWKIFASLARKYEVLLLTLLPSTNGNTQRIRNSKDWGAGAWPRGCVHCELNLEQWPIVHYWLGGAGAQRRAGWPEQFPESVSRYREPARLLPSPAAGTVVRKPRWCTGWLETSANSPALWACSMALIPVLLNPNCRPCHYPFRLLEGLTCGKQRRKDYPE